MKTFVCRYGLISAIAGMLWGVVVCGQTETDVDPRLKLAAEKGLLMAKVNEAVAKKDFEAACKAIDAFYPDDKYNAAARKAIASREIDPEDRQRAEKWMLEASRLFGERVKSQQPPVVPGVVAPAMKPGVDSKVVWLSAYAEAASLAAKEKKPLLIDFGGSDWNPASQLLHTEVFWSERFARDVAPKFILLAVDFPRYNKLPQELREQNQKLYNKYAITGVLPTVLVVDPADGAAYARLSGYGMHRADAFIDAILAASNSPDAKRKEKEADGDRLRAYELVIKADREAQRKVWDERERLGDAQQAAIRRRIDDAVSGKDFEAAAKAIDELQGFTKSRAAKYKAEVSLLIDPKDKARALKYMDEAIALDGGLNYVGLKYDRDNIANGTTPAQMGLSKEAFGAAQNDLMVALASRDFEKGCAAIDKMAAGNKSAALHYKAMFSLKVDPKDKARALKLMDEAIANSADLYKPALQQAREKMAADETPPAPNIVSPPSGLGSGNGSIPRPSPARPATEKREDKGI